MIGLHAIFMTFIPFATVLHVSPQLNHLSSVTFVREPLRTYQLRLANLLAKMLIKPPSTTSTPTEKRAQCVLGIISPVHKVTASHLLQILIVVGRIKQTACGLRFLEQQPTLIPHTSFATGCLSSRTCTESPTRWAVAITSEINPSVQRSLSERVISIATTTL